MSAATINPVGVSIPFATGESVPILAGSGATTFATPTTAGQVLGYNGTNIAFVADSSQLGYQSISTSTGTAQVQANNVVTAAGAVSVALPTTAAQGQQFIIACGAGVTTLTQATGQTVLGLNGETTGSASTGTIIMQVPYSSMLILCTTANTGFQVTLFTGSLTFTQ